MNAFGLTTYDDHCARCDGSEERDASDDEAEERAYVASLISAGAGDRWNENTNGETGMDTQPNGFDEDEVSGVMVTAESIGVRLEPPTVEEIDLLPADAEEAARKAEAFDALSFLQTSTVIGLLLDVLDGLDDTRATGVILARSCRLSDEGMGLVASQLLQVLGNKVIRHRAAADASRVVADEACARADEARASQRAAECAVLNALGSYAHENIFAKVG